MRRVSPIVKTPALLLIIAAFVSAFHPAQADFPRDPNRTLQNARGGRIRVGVVENRPWAVKNGNDAGGVEAELIKNLAAELGAQVEWHWGGEQSHMEALERFELDLVIGGITSTTPWKKKIGLSHEYYDEHVIATPPGENGWIKRLDEFLSSRSGQVQAMVEKERT